MTNATRKLRHGFYPDTVGYKVVNFYWHGRWVLSWRLAWGTRPYLIVNRGKDSIGWMWWQRRLSRAIGDGSVEVRYEDEP